jgi:hypothetical protein
MSFTNDAKRVRDDNAPIGLRYMSLRHCVEKYSPYGFRRTWRLLEERFGIREGEVNSPGSLVAALEFLEKDRADWLAFIEARATFAKARARRKLPKPRIEVKHGKF